MKYLGQKTHLRIKKFPDQWESILFSCLLSSLKGVEPHEKLVLEGKTHMYYTPLG